MILPRHLPARPANDLVTARLTVGSCRRGMAALTNCACISLLYRMRLPAGVERERVEENAQEVLRLAHWLAGLIEDET